MSINLTHLTAILIGIPVAALFSIFVQKIDNRYGYGVTLIVLAIIVMILAAILLLWPASGCG